VESVVLSSWMSCRLVHVTLLPWMSRLWRWHLIAAHSLSLQLAIHIDVEVKNNLEALNSARDEGI